MNGMNYIGLDLRGDWLVDEKQESPVKPSEIALLP